MATAIDPTSSRATIYISACEVLQLETFLVAISLINVWEKRKGKINTIDRNQSADV